MITYLPWLFVYRRICQDVSNRPRIQCQKTNISLEHHTVYEMGYQQVGRAQPTGVGPQTCIDRPYLCTYISCTLEEYEGLKGL